MAKLKPDVLRHNVPTNEDVKKVTRNPIFLVLDNVIDTYNIGSLFRLSDAIGVEKLFICGASEYPPSSRIHKAAVGTENWVAWEKFNNTIDAIKRLKEQGVQIVCVEQHPTSISYKLLPTKLKFPCAIVVGNETLGISKEVLAEGDLIVELPMCGINNSFNVWGSAAVVGYKILENI